MVNTELLEQKIYESGKTKSFLSRKAGMVIQTFRNKCKNQNEFTLSEVDALCTELNIKSLAEKERIFFAK